MSQQYPTIEDARVRLGPRSLATGPGQLGRAGAAGAVLWNAGAGAAALDLFGLFWAGEAGNIDWLDGFVCDPALSAWFALMANPPEEAEEPEELFSRASMNTLEATLEDQS